MKPSSPGSPKKGSASHLPPSSQIPSKTPQPSVLLGNAEKPLSAFGRGSKSAHDAFIAEALYCESLLPKGVTLLDAAKFFVEQRGNALLSTVKDVAESYRDTALKGASAKYREEQWRFVGDAVSHFGARTLFKALTKPQVIGYIRSGSTYWVRYSRKRAVSVLVTEALLLDVIEKNPLLGFRLEDAPKRTPHYLKHWEVDAILEFTAREAPRFLNAFALQLLMGIRTEELCRPVEIENGRLMKRPLWWSDISFGLSINMPAEVTKTGYRRTLDYWPPALTRWMRRPKRGDTPLCPVLGLEDAKTKLLRNLRRERKAAKLPPVDFRQNDFRRTYATFSIAAFGVEKTKARMGHEDSSKMLRRHYDGGLPPEVDALGYFGSGLDNPIP